MSQTNETCTCQNFSCTLHPRNHNKGCTPCINKNLRLREIPNCFFNLIPNADKRDGDTFHSFAELVVKNDAKS